MKTLRIVVAVLAVLIVIGAVNRLLTDGTLLTESPSSRAPKQVAQKVSAPARLCSMVLTDEEMRDWQWGVRDDTMRVLKVQRFLEEKESILAVKDGKLKYVPAAVIVEVAKKFSINPLVILVTLQKEQGIIVRSDPASPNYNGRVPNLAFAMGYNKPSTLLDQIYDGTWQFDRYLSAPWAYRFRAGAGTETQDGVMAFPQNDATAALYNYTPYAGKRCGGNEHIGGVGLFLELWESWSKWQP